jgi:hypothetical protein
MQLLIVFLISIISANDIPIASGEDYYNPIISLNNYTDIYLNSTTITTSITPCVTSSIFSIAYQIITNIISGNNNSTISNPCNSSNNIVPSYYYIFPLIALINEWMWFYKL